MNRLTDCGAANLLAVIFGEEPNDIKKKLGITVPHNNCLQCGTDIELNRIFCNHTCQKKYNRIELICPECGKTFTRTKSQIIYRLNHKYPNNGKIQEYFYCSKKCLGKIAAREYGFLAHPENRYRKSQQLSINTILIRWLYRLNFTILEISKILGLHHGHVHNIIYSYLGKRKR